jgi:peptidoglycan/LPS O-acetylase OafA/YrhL
MDAMHLVLERGTKTAGTRARISERSSRPTQAQPENLLELTGLRFIAAFSVLIAHGVSTILNAGEKPLSGLVFWLSQASGFGMTLFFVLSGFVIHYNYATLITTRGTGGIAAYLWARFARLYPLFILTLLINIMLSRSLVELWSGHSELFARLLGGLPYFLVFVHSWFYAPIGGVPLVGTIGGGSPLTWSISTEWFFYLAYVLMAFVVLRLNRPATILLAGLAFGFVWVAAASTLYDRTPDMDAWAVTRYGAFAATTNDFQDSFARWLQYMSPYLRIGEFIVGCLVAQLFVRLRDRPVSHLETTIGKIGLVVAVASVFVITYAMYSPDVGANLFRRLDMNFGLGPSSALLIFCAIRYNSLVARALRTRACRALGEASYSIYLIHYIVLMIVVRSGGVAVPATAAITPWSVIKLVVVLAIILLLSLMAYAYYEAPARRWLRSLWGPAVAGRALAAAAVACPAVIAILVLVAREPILVSLQSTVDAASTHFREACAAKAPGSVAWQTACGAVAALAVRR